MKQLSEKDIILGIKRALAKEVTSSDDDEDFILCNKPSEKFEVSISDLNPGDQDKEIWHNWHHKLNYKSQYVSKNYLRSWDYLYPMYPTVTTYASTKRNILKLKNLSEDDNSYDASDEPYTGLDLNKILSPIYIPSDFLIWSRNRSSLKDFIQQIADLMLSAITNEHEFNSRLKRLVSVLIGDYPYQFQTFDSSMANGLIPSQNLNYEKMLGMTREEKFEIIKVLQAAIDRSSEYIRCLNRIRNHLTTGYRLFEQIESWCRQVVELEEEQKKA